jgi:predicted nucleic acid-binding protein
MTVHYLDSSAWLKQFFEEPGSAWIKKLVVEQEPIASASLGYVEVTASLVRQQQARKLTDEQLAQAIETVQGQWHRFFQVQLDSDVADLAFSLARQWKLRGADAMHLAAADHLRRQLTESETTVALVAADEELLAAAQAIGFRIINPVLEESRASN